MEKAGEEWRKREKNGEGGSPELEGEDDMRRQKGEKEVDWEEGGRRERR